MKEVSLPSLKENAIIPLMDSGVQIYHIIESIIGQVGPVEITATTFSVAEEFLRAMFRLKKEGKVKSLDILCDLKSAEKTARINNLLRNIADNVYLAENHSKVVLLQAEGCCVSIVTSQNQTRGNRTEGAIITTDEGVYQYFADYITDMIANDAVLWRSGEPLPKK